MVYGKRSCMINPQWPIKSNVVNLMDAHRRSIEGPDGAAAWRAGVMLRVLALGVS